MMNDFLLTFDTDWAPDFVIDDVVDRLVTNKIKSTWFITHNSPSIKKIIENNELFEVGIHPNFFPNSTQGKNENEVMSYFDTFLPNSKIMRTHALYQSTFLLRKLVKDHNIEIDVSLLLSHSPNLIPHKIFLGDGIPGIIRVPFFWEDDLEMYNPTTTWELKQDFLHTSGLKVFNFHPIHIYLNSANMKNYEILKEKYSFLEGNKEDFESLKNQTTNGVLDFFKQTCEYILNEQKVSYKISEIVDRWKKNSH